MFYTTSKFLLKACPYKVSESYLQQGMTIDFWVNLQYGVPLKFFNIYHSLNNVLTYLLRPCLKHKYMEHREQVN